MAYHGSGHYRRSLQDVDALGLFHHGRGIGRHVGNLDDARRSVGQIMNDLKVSYLVLDLGCVDFDAPSLPT